jgi:hypothetical protein
MTRLAEQRQRSSGKELGIVGVGVNRNNSHNVCSGLTRTSSHSQQSLHLRHLPQMWFSQASLVHQTQMRVAGSPQM